MLPTSLQPVNSASKKLQPVMVHCRNAASVCREALSLTLRNEQFSKTLPSLTPLVRSMCENEQLR